MSASPVLIVGAGPTGLVLAIELARRGVPCHLVDCRPKPLGRDRAIVVKSRSLEIFHALGLADVFLQRGRIIRGIDLFSGGAKVASVGLGGLDSPFPFDLCLPEEETERILTDELERLGGRVERGVEFAGLEQGQHSVRARLHSLRDGERMLVASWVIGTDGVHSGVRETIGDEFDGHDYPTLWGVADAHVAGWRRPRDHATVQIEPPVVIAFPLRGGRWRFTFRPDPERDDILATVGARLAAISPGAALQDPDEPQLFHTHARVARRYRIGRVLLAGDAAHACTPFEGHGMNTGIQDSHNLGWKLALVVTGAALESLLDSYEAERRPVAQTITHSGDDAEARAAPHNVTERQALIQFLATPEGRRAAAIAEAEIAFGYPESPIVDEVPARRTVGRGTQVGFWVGDAAPLRGRNRTFRLHELIGAPGHALFLMLGEADPAAVEDGLALIRATAERYRPHVQAYLVTRSAPADGNDADELLADPTGALHERLGAAQPCLCLVRPDGHLGFRGTPPSLEALRAHLRRIFGSCGAWPPPEPVRPFSASGVVMAHVYSFPPIASRMSRVLILGTMPGKVSLRERQYYAHPQNAFWRIMGEVLGFGPASPYDTRIAAVQSAGIAIWDVLKSCERPSSLDSAIDASSAVPNDFTAFLAEHSQIQRICFNGAKAEALYVKHVRPGLTTNLDVQHLRLPSTSPANASVSFSEKVRAWQAIAP